MINTIFFIRTSKRFAIMEEFIQDLPLDIQQYIYKIVLEVRRPKVVMSLIMKMDIESYHLFDFILEKYKLVYGDFHESWLNNDMISFLNDHEGFMNGLNPGLRNVFPNLTDDEIIIRIMDHYHIKTYWIAMSAQKRLNMFLTTYAKPEMHE